MKDRLKTTDEVVIMEGAVVCGDVTIGSGSSVWFNAVVRADGDKVTIGKDTNIQECCVVHVDAGFPVEIGDGVTVGHGCIVHGCTVGSNTLLGMGSILLNGARIGRDCIIGAGSVVTGNTKIEDGWMAFGNPAKPVRPLRPEEVEHNRESSAHYKAAREPYRD